MLQEMEPLHLEQQLELRQRQLQEVAGTFRVSPVLTYQGGENGRPAHNFATTPRFAKMVISLVYVLSLIHI